MKKIQSIRIRVRLFLFDINTLKNEFQGHALRDQAARLRCSKNGGSAMSTYH